MSPKYVLVETKDYITTLTLNRPEKRNAFTNEMFLEARDAFAAAEADAATRVLIVTGAGQAFSAGGDLEAFRQAAAETKRTGALVSPLDQAALEGWALAMRRMTKPTIAAVNGAAMGLGCTLPLACDMRIASERARLGLVFLEVGLNPEFGSSYYLPRLVGIAKACELVLSAKTVDAQEALAIGLVNEVVPHEELLPRARALAGRIASLPPLAVRWARTNLYAGLDGDLLNQVQREIMANRNCRLSKDYDEALAARQERRAPVFRGH
ncbi:MAG: enoyl-CoA hydratase [Dehalococcoidia bacterium]|nr:enoyl-CoA hydratase [Dehalococcoidia bacterium]